MFTIGMNSYANSFFAITTMAVGIPTGIKIFNWLGTMWGGKLIFKTPMLFCIGFLFQFLIAGLTGIMLSSAPFNWQLSGSYFVVAHFHYRVIVGGILFALFAAFYYWYPKGTGRMLTETLGKLHFWLFVIGFHLTFDLMHVPGLMGMPRRIYTYRARPRLGHVELPRHHLARSFRQRRHAHLRREYDHFLLQRRQSRKRSLGRVDSRVDDQFAATGLQLCVYPQRFKPKAAVGSQASRRIRTASMSKSAMNKDIDL